MFKYVIFATHKPLLEREVDKIDEFMNFKSYYTALILLMLSVGMANAREVRTEIGFDFRVGSIVVDTLYRENSVSLRNLDHLLQQIHRDSTLTIKEVRFCGTASPEGNSELNRKLSRGRLSAIENLIRHKIQLPDSIITHDDNYISWEHLKEQVQSSSLTRKDAILQILNEEGKLVKYGNRGAMIDLRVLKLQRISGGSEWRKMQRQYFASMRNACALFVTVQKETPHNLSPITKIYAEAADTTAVTPLIPVTADTAVILKEEITTEAFDIDLQYPARRLSVKTNALGWALSVANAAVEIDLSEHWSFTLPVYWSAMNYFCSEWKFRTLSFQPEVRYHFKPDNGGWFVGTHFGISWYNISTGGSYRTQDHDGNSPAIGGGLSAGYKMPLFGSRRWQLEFTLGLGVYSLHQDKFDNRRNGLLVRTEKKTYVGPDQLSVSLSYFFDLGKQKGGHR